VAEPITVTVKVSDAGNGELNTEVIYPEGGAQFVNKYYADGSVTLKGTKILTGGREQTIGTKEFNFLVTEQITDANGNVTEKEVATGYTVSANADTDVTGENVETTGNTASEAAEATGDTASDTANATGDSTSDTIGDNTSDTAAASDQTVEEGVSDAELFAEEEELTDEELAAVAKDTASIQFTEIKYTQDDIGTHTYIISEKQGEDPTIVYTDKTVTVTVKVSDAGNGKLKAEVTYPNGGATFTNEYHASGSIELKAAKELTGNRAAEIGEKEFTFTVKEKGKEVATGYTVGTGAAAADTTAAATDTADTKDADTATADTADAVTDTTATADIADAANISEVKFTEIAYTQDDIGTHTYVISENIGTDPDIGYVAEPVTVTVTVSDAGQGKLNVAAEYPDQASEAKFVNEYYAEGEVEFTAEKLLPERAAEIAENEFTFVVNEIGTDADGQATENEVAAGYTLEGGVVEFDEIEYTQDDIGTHTYVIRENIPMAADQTDADQTDVDQADAGQTAADQIGTDQTSTDQAVADPTIGYVAEPITVTVKVSDAGNGELDTEVIYPEGGAQFVNKYYAEGSVTLEGTKILTGGREQTIGTKEFNFLVTEQITDANGNVTEKEVATGYTVNANADTDVTGENAETTGNTASEAADAELFAEEEEEVTDEALAGVAKDTASIQFTEIKYTQDDIGTHTYVISELQGQDPTITYSQKTVTVTVTVSDAGNGQLNAVASYPVSGARFVNEYHATGAVDLTAVKKLNGNRAAAIRADEFAFTVKENGREVATGTTQNGGAVTFSEIDYTQDDIGTHMYVISEDVEEAITADNEGSEAANGSRTISYTQDDIGSHDYVISENAGEDPTIGYVAEPMTVTVVVSDAGNGKLKTTVSYPDNQAEATFTNEYYAVGEAEFEAVKELTGNRAKEIEDGEFTFTVTEQGKEGDPVATGKTLAGGNVQFTEIVYSQDDIGEHTYIISEDEGSDSSISYAADPVTVTVKVSDAGEGELDTEITYPEGGVRFVNEYHAEGEIELTAEKTLTGDRAAEIGAGEFTFTVLEGNTEVAAGETLAGGTVEFTPITYTQDDIGIHTYLIRENPGTDGTIGYVAEPVTVTVAVSDAGAGKLNAEAVYPEGGAKFVNDYYADGTLELTALKELTGSRAEAIKAGEFTFTVTEGDTEVATGDTLAGGTVKFTPITYTQDEIGTHEYVISETIPENPDPTIGYTAEPVTVTVVVSDAGEGRLNTEVIYPEGGARFVNEYHAEGEIELTAEKTLTGGREAEIGAGEFTFTVTEQGKDGDPAATGKTLAGGTIEFTKIVYSQDDIGEHTYIISEDEGSDSSIGYVAEPVTVTVKVSDAGEGKLNTEITYPEGGAKFVNDYYADGTLKLTAQKELTGGRVEAVKAGEFTFTVTEGDTEVAVGETLAGGTVEFTPITYTQDDIGSHEYVISETIPKNQDPTISYTAKPVTVTVEVRDAGNGVLIPEVTYPEGGAKFVNEYHTSGSVMLNARKELTGSTLQADEFVFELKDADGKVLQTKQNLENGSITFDALEYSEKDIGQTFTYTVSEKDTGIEGVTYSKAVYTVNVIVSAASDNTLETTTEITTEGHSVNEMVFENTFEGSVTLQKTGPDGEKLSGASFELYQKTENGWELYTADQQKGSYVTDQNGIIQVTGLTENEYCFVETEAPDGYSTVIEADGSRRKYSFQIGLNSSDATASAQLDITDQKTRIVILRQDDKGNPIIGSILRIVDADGNTIDEWTTDGTPHVITGVLVEGKTYRLVDVYEPEGYQIADDIMFTFAAGSGDAAGNGDAEGDAGGMSNMIAMIAAAASPASGKAKITKNLTMDGKPIAAEDACFYIALFKNADCTKRVTEIKKLTFAETSSVSVEFGKLESGTYYLSETDANGTAISQGSLLTGEVYIPDYIEGQKVKVSGSKTTTLSFNNEFAALPSGFQREGELTITKQFQDADGAAKNSDAVFYAGIFEDADFTKLASGVAENIAALSLNGSSSVSATIRVTLPDSGATTLYVTEVDENGTPVAQAAEFPYEVTVDHTEVTLTADATAAEVVITNREQAETETETEPKATPTVPETDSPVESVQTGDNTPVERYVTLLAASAVLLLIAEEERRRRRSKKQ
jgi:pilin isopeptide linkage protein